LDKTKNKWLTKVNARLTQELSDNGYKLKIVWSEDIIKEENLNNIYKYIINL